MAIQWTPVVSSNLRSVGYDPDTETLQVEFISGTIYEYDKVPPDLHSGLMLAQSKGMFFAANIRGNPKQGYVPFNYRRIR